MQRIVIKVGSGVLTKNDGIAEERMLNLVQLIAKLKEKYEVILVSSGAVSAGYTERKINTTNIGRKVLAAIGQPILMSSYKRLFEIFEIPTSQILLTEEDFDSTKRTEIFQKIVNGLLKHNVIPIINENDISTTPEQVFGDNDQLSANVCQVTDSELLVILSDIDGYYDKNPSEHKDAKIIKKVTSISKKELEDDVTPNHEFASGGIVTKLKAAKFIMENNKKMFLCSGYELETAEDFLLNDNHTKGTIFSSK